jgi:isochorismate hydrolase
MAELSPKAGEPVLERNRYSAFFDSELDAMLRAKGIDTLIIGGSRRTGSNPGFLFSMPI